MELKRFINNDGTFEIHIASTWKYSLIENKIHTFNNYQIWKADTFKLSINHLDSDQAKENFKIESAKWNKSTDCNDMYILPPDSDNEFTTQSICRQFDDRITLFTYTSLNNPDSDLDNMTIEDKTRLFYSIAKSFKFIEHASKDSVIQSYRFEMFLQGVEAAILILSNSIKNKSFIETTCVLASLVDASLRTGIILKTQLDNKNKDIDLKWIYQGAQDKIIMEKKIYEEALDLNIITQEIRAKLDSLYNDRNRVIHRFIISEMTLAEVEGVGQNYNEMLQQINQIVYSLESEQVKLNIGMTTLADKDIINDRLNSIKGKIGINEYFYHK